MELLRKPVLLAAVPLGLVMLAMGASKLLTPETARAEFVHWGYPAWFARVVGITELVGAMLVLWPGMRFFGAILLAGVLLGAVVTHLRVPEVGFLPLAVPLLALASLVAWRTRPAFLGGAQPAAHG